MFRWSFLSYYHGVHFSQGYTALLFLATLCEEKRTSGLFNILGITYDPV